MKEKIKEYKESISSKNKFLVILSIICVIFNLILTTVFAVKGVYFVYEKARSLCLKRKKKIVKIEY